MKALLLALVLTVPQLGQQTCTDCFGSPAYWERQAQQETRERLDRIEQREIVRQMQNYDQPRDVPRGTTPSIWDCPTCPR